ncbi:MAG TPA: hypothetical protein VFS43_19875 [Polyangiaceae bacterium]|nr:hypothetical protein [Polyangiaceae bacterium]
MSPRFALDLERLYADAVLASRLAGAVCNRATTWPILSAYRGPFTKSAVSFRTSTRAPAEQRDAGARRALLQDRERLQRVHDGFDASLTISRRTNRFDRTRAQE